jgi:rhodanese-related sulfurtransferase
LGHGVFLLSLYKDKKIVVVCRSGGRAGQAIQTLQEKGFQNLQNGGAWENFK